MAKVNTKAFVSLKKYVADIPSKSISDKVKREVGNAVIAKMRQMIAGGISTIDSAGRFPAYKAAGSRDRKRYPYNTAEFKRGSKKVRPVNLRLSGLFLASLTITSFTRFGLYIGFADALSKKKERGHREGAGGQPPRPIIPEQGEQFNATIRTEIIKRMKSAVSAAIRGAR